MLRISHPPQEWWADKLCDTSIMKEQPYVRVFVFVFVFVFVCVFFFVFVYLDEEGATQRFPPDDENKLQRRAPATRDLLQNDHLQDQALDISAIIVSNYPRELEDLEDLDEDLEDRDEELDLENQLLMELVNEDIYKYFKHHP